MAKRYGKPSPVFGPIMVLGGRRGPDSGDLPSEQAMAKVPPRRTTFCRAENKWREFRAWEEPKTGLCPDCEHELGAQARALDKQGVRSGNMPEGWVRTQA